MLEPRTRSRRVWNLYLVCAFCTLLLVSFLPSGDGYWLSTELIAAVLLYVCLYPTARYFARQERGVPVFGLLCMAYALQFAVPVFVSRSQIALVNGEIRQLEEHYVLSALWLSMLGVAGLQLGFYALQSKQVARTIGTIDLHLDDKKALVYCVLVGIVVPLTAGLRNSLSEEWGLRLSAILTLLQNQQLVVVGILGWLVHSGRGTKWHKVLLYLVIGLTVWRGLSSGFLEQAVLPLIIFFVTKWLYVRKLSLSGATVVFLIILFLSPVKASFRQSAWGEDAAGSDTAQSFITTPVLWFDQAYQYWTATISGEGDVVSATSAATSRADLIHQFAHIYSLTPSVIPFQYGETYSYFIVALIPRAIWPDKPQAGGANNFFAVAFGITSEEGAKKSTFGVSLLGEGYINFGIPGVFLIMFLQGCVFAVLQLVFGRERSGTGGQMIFLAFFVFFLNGVGTSAEIFFGNILQNLLGSCLLLMWVRESSRQRRARMEFTNRALPSST
jgi:hypothetical protein